jgi:lycopene cyclase domain-containing protein
MGLRHWSYVAMLAFCLLATLPLARAFGLKVLRQRQRLVATIVVAGAPFLAWDLYAFRAGHWRFDPAQTLPWRVAGLPVEEVGFFVVVPLATVLTYEAVRAVRRRHRAGPRRERREVS